MITSEFNYKDNLNLEILKHDVKFRKLLNVKQINFLVWNKKTCLKKYVKFNIKNYAMD